jgi:hypothetical protein
MRLRFTLMLLAFAITLANSLGSEKGMRLLHGF